MYIITIQYDTEVKWCIVATESLGVENKETEDDRTDAQNVTGQASSFLTMFNRWCARIAGSGWRSSLIG